MISLYLVGFPCTESRDELGGSQRDVDSTNWINQVPHLVPEARVFDFTPFAAGVAGLDRQPPSPGNTVDDNADVNMSEGDLQETDQDESESLDEHSDQGDAESSRECVEREALLLLDAVKKQDPKIKKVRLDQA